MGAVDHGITMEAVLKSKINNFLSSLSKPVVCAIDLETLVADTGAFLSGESIICVSFSILGENITSFAYIAENDGTAEEMRILRELDLKLAEVNPDIIIGYNHTGYDIPLIVSKIRNLAHEDRNRNIEYYFGTSWCLDMKYLIAEDLYLNDGYYKIRKLDDVLVHQKYANLKTMKVKDIARIEGMQKGDAIKHLWLSDRDKFRRYSIGDTYDLLLLFTEILKGPTGLN